MVFTISSAWEKLINKRSSHLPVQLMPRRAIVAVVHKVYPRDHHRLEFLGHSIHALAAAAETPFLTTGAKRRFRSRDKQNFRFAGDPCAIHKRASNVD